MTENGPVGAREERFAANEALFREVNERVAEIASHYQAESHGGGVDADEPLHVTTHPS